MTPEVRVALAELVASVAAAEPFLNAAALREEVLAPATDTWRDWMLARPLGLVYWLANWKRPEAPRGRASWTNLTLKEGG